MQGRAFINGIHQKLDSIAPIVLPGIIKKQLMEVGASMENLSPEQAEMFIKKMEEALSMFMGPEGTKMAHQIMMKELRKCAPNYFEENALV